VEKHCTAGHATDDKIIRRMRIPCWIPKATNTHSEYVIFIAFPLQQKSHEGPTILRSRPMPVLYHRSVHPITYILTSCSRHFLLNFFICLLFSIRTHLCSRCRPQPTYTHHMTTILNSPPLQRCVIPVVSRKD